MRSAEFGDLESVAEEDTQHHSEKVAVLQISEMATACNITQISTPQHTFLRNFPYILNTLLLQNSFRLKFKLLLPGTVTFSPSYQQLLTRLFASVLSPSLLPLLDMQFHKAAIFKSR